MLYKKIVVKVGSNVLTQADGLPDLLRMKNLVQQIADLKKQHIAIILVSSGAVAFGRSIVQASEKNDTIAQRQLFSSVGQVKLMQKYSELFAEQGLTCAQVLVTKEDFRDRRHYLNMKNCLDTLLQNNIVPIINENDVISITELMFTDNDELAGLLTSMMNVEALFILTNVNGIYNGNPKDPQSQLIPVIDNHMLDFESFISTEKSNFGRGGMVTKSNIAKRVAKLGIAVHIVNGKTDFILTETMQGKSHGTFFKPHKESSSIKKWLAHADGFVKGMVYINEGAKQALFENKANSLLLVGITKIEGQFDKGDILKIVDEKGSLLGLGISQYDDEKAIERMGWKNQKPLIHYDYLFLY
ncbi:MAG: glutamate 5-kinase [Thermoflexibacter sp.]